MLNYDIATGESRKLNKPTTGTPVVLHENPFPGLRPFKLTENHLFFGREGQVDEILQKLSVNRFITVIGYSGSGKSSLMHCGLIPVLYGGFMTSAGSDWKIIATRPGNNPYNNLAESIVNQEKGFKNLDDSEKQLKTTVIASLLRSGPGGFVEVIKNLQKKSGKNIFLLIDQFEELFRYADLEGSPVTQDDAMAYVQLVLESIRQSEVPIYLAVTLRSDYIGRCADFPGLTDKINDSNYLVPQMSRDQKKLVIEGPVAVGGAKISQRLVKRLLNDITDHQDQLPILQHAMMRTWDYWVEHREGDEPLDIRHYQAVGAIFEALSQHADVAYDALDSRQKEIAEVLFKTLTLKTTENQGIRRAAKISVVAEISGAHVDEVIQVVEEFRKPGRSFLMPTPQVKLYGDSNIEISHESLMRIWVRLKAWVDEEYESAQMYKRLSEAAAMYQIGKTGLWRPPDLQLALNWQKKQRPTRAWGQRYDEAFERAIVFLDTSRITYEAEQKNQEMVQKRLLRRTKIVAVVLGAAAVISILFFVFAVTQQLKATHEAEIAKDNERQAIENANQAKRAEDELEEKNKSLDSANINLLLLNDKMADSTVQLERQRSSLQQLLYDLQLAEKEAQDEAQKAIEKSILAQEYALRATDNFERAQTLLGLSVAQSMAIKSALIDEPDLRSIVARQAYLFHRDNNGRINDPYIYDALHNAVDMQFDDNYNSYKISNYAIRSAEYGKDYIYATGSDGRVIKINKNSKEDRSVILKNNFPNQFLKLSHNEKWLIVVSDSSFLQVLSTDSGDKKLIRGHSGYIRDIAFMPGSIEFYSLGSDQKIRINNPATGQSTLFKELNYPAKSITVHPDGNIIALGTDDSRVFLLNKMTKVDQEIIAKGKNNPAHTVDFHPDGKLLAVGYEKGMVDIYDLDLKAISKDLYGQISKVSKVQFSPDGKYLATSSFDKTIYLWALNGLDELPIIMEDHSDFVWDISFSPNSEYIVASIGSGELKIWPLRPEEMATKICEMAFRNMTPVEWKMYVGTKIEYQRTCEDLPDVF